VLSTGEVNCFDIRPMIAKTHSFVVVAAIVAVVSTMNVYRCVWRRASLFDLPLDI
jgi:hypothetical protein